MDPEAVTFKPKTKSTANISEVNNENKCPPGTVPESSLVIGIVNGDKKDETVQSPNYPGPNIGGTYKEFKVGNPRPSCPAGFSNIAGIASGSYEGSSSEKNTYEASKKGSGTVSVSGDQFGLNIGGKQYDIPACIPTKLCASFEDIRKALFGEDYQKDEEKNMIASSIEALFCVELIKGNKPETPYGPNENCIDCHIHGMNKSLEKVLETNVTPLANTMTGFGISNKWGPNFSFNLSTMVKARVTQTPRVRQKAGALEGELFNEIKSKLADTGDKSSETETYEEKAKRVNEENKRNYETMKEALENFELVNDNISDGSMLNSVKPLIDQWTESFKRIQAKYDELTRDEGGALIQLKNKDQCE